MNAGLRGAVSILLVVVAAPALAATKYWTGAGGNALWSNSANWQGNLAPTDGDDLVFTVGDTPTLTTTNDFASITLHIVEAVKRDVDTFIHGKLEIQGNAFSITGSFGPNVIVDANVTLAASQSWLIAGYPSSPLVLNGAVNLNGYTLTAGGYKNFVTFNGNVTGNGAIVASGAADTGGITFNGHVSINGPITEVSGPVTFSNTNTFTGSVTISGTVNNDLQFIDVSTPGAFPAGCQVLFGAGSSGAAQLKLGSNSLTQPSLSGFGGIRLNGGSVTLTNAANATLYGAIYGQGALNVTGGNQTLALDGAITTTVSNNATLFVDGTLVVSGATVSGATTTVGPGTLKLRDAHLDTINAGGGALSLLEVNSATNLTLNSASNFIVPLGRGIAISGSVSIGNSALALTPPAQPQIGATYTIISNTGAGSTAGTFAGYPEGSTFTLNGVAYSITYHGGGGKDVVITAIGTPTQTSLTSHPNPSLQMRPVTLTAGVTSSGAPVTAGNVAFFDGTTVLGTSVLNAAGIATFQTSSLSPGTHNLTAMFNGSDSFGSSTSHVVTQTVTPTAPTQIAVSGSPNPSQFTWPVTLTATVSSGSGVPTGTVTFYDGSTLLGAVTMNGGTATHTVTSLGLGFHNITAVYSGDDAFSPSTSSVVLQFVKGGAATATSLTTSDDTTEIGEPVAFRAFVQSAFGIPDGTVLFSNDGMPLGTGTLDASGIATFTTSALAGGTHSIVATFAGDNGFSGSTSSPVAQTVLTDCPFPIFASGLSDVTVRPQSDVTLSVSTTSGQQEQFAWFSGSYPDVSDPLGVTSPVLSLLNVENSVRVWVRVSNACGSVYSSAMVAVPTPPKRRAVPH